MYKLLIVDDQERIRTLIKKYALLEGHEVFEAQNGLEAVSICRKEKFDIIISWRVLSFNSLRTEKFSVFGVV